MNKCMEIKEKIETTAVEVGATAMVKATNAVNKLSAKRMKKVITVLPIMLIALSLVTVPAFAEAGAGGGTDADSFINEIISLLQTWIPRLGGMIVVVGGIQLGIGFKDDNADGKTRGMQCMIGGAIVAAIGGLVNF